MINDARLVKMDSEIHKLAVYYVLQKCCSVGLERMIHVWNHRSIPRKWIPNSLDLNNGTHPIHNIWNSNCSYSWFWDQHQGGSITDPSEFGEDSSGDNDVLLQHCEQFWQNQVWCSCSSYLQWTHGRRLSTTPRLHSDVYRNHTRTKSIKKFVDQVHLELSLCTAVFFFWKPSTPWTVQQVLLLFLFFFVFAYPEGQSTPCSLNTNTFCQVCLLLVILDSNPIHRQLQIKSEGGLWSRLPRI